MLNQVIEDELGKGDCHHQSKPYTLVHHLPTASTIAADSSEGVRDGALRINHAHEELMGMGDHPC